MVIYILTKFGADWLIFVDASVLTRKLWSDRHWTDGHRRRVLCCTRSITGPLPQDVFVKHECPLNGHFLKKCDLDILPVP